MTGRLLGIGSPLVDLAAEIPDADLRELPGVKGGTEHLSLAALRELAAGRHCTVKPGGAAANTVQAAARLGTRAALAGKLGKDDFGRIFKADFQDAGADLCYLWESPTEPTGCCLDLVTPDGERTMRSTLGASAHLTEAELNGIRFDQFDWILLEGYMLETEFFASLMKKIAASSCRLALDLSSFELAARYREQFITLIATSVSLLFANEDEAAALTGTVQEPEAQLRQLNTWVPLAVLKCGAAGAYLGERGEKPVFVPASAAGPVVDTTGAGDYFAAGFLHGLLSGRTPEKALRCGALLAGEIITVQGARLPAGRWTFLKKQLDNL